MIIFLLQLLKLIILFPLVWYLPICLPQSGATGAHFIIAMPKKMERIPGHHSHLYFCNLVSDFSSDFWQKETRGD